MQRSSRIVLALDFASAAEASKLIKRIKPEQCRIKVGLELFTAAGPDFVHNLTHRGFDVFLDLKFHDIPNTVGRACEQVAKLGIWMLSLHITGGRAMLETARVAIQKTPMPPLLIGVTVLTSLDTNNMPEIGVGSDLNTQVMRLARLAHSVGLDGVVCAPTDAKLLRRDIGPNFKLVTPGIRPTGMNADDQRRLLPPKEAIACGADFLVIGRPVTRASDPIAMLDRINQEIEG